MHRVNFGLKLPSRAAVNWLRTIPIALVLTLGSAGTASAAVAAPSATGDFAEQARRAGLEQAEAAQLQARVDEVLARMKVGGHQVSANEVVSNDGKVWITVPLPGEERARSLSTGAGVQASCPYKWLCLYDAPNFGGLFARFYYCEFVNLGDYGLHDRLTSYINNQTPFTFSDFYNWNDRWVWKWESEAFNYDPDLGRWGWSNIIDGVWVC